MSYDPFRNYDAWLEEPYQRHYAQQEAFAEMHEKLCSSDDPDNCEGDCQAGEWPEPEPTKEYMKDRFYEPSEDW